MHFFTSRPRLFVSIVAGFFVFGLLPKSLGLHLVTRLIIGWDATTCLYLILAALMIQSTSHDGMKLRAKRLDDGKFVVLAMVVVAAVFSLGAILLELGVAKNFSGLARNDHIFLALITILLSWGFTQMMFAFHYAHNFYNNEAMGVGSGLLFPNLKTPDYIDFLYFSCVIGTSAQTADVNITGQAMRKVVLVHSVLAFFFNTVLLALLVNVAAGLI